MLFYLILCLGKLLPVFPKLDTEFLFLLIYFSYLGVFKVFVFKHFFSCLEDSQKFLRTLNRFPPPPFLKFSTSRIVSISSRLFCVSVLCLVFPVRGLLKCLEKLNYPFLIKTVGSCQYVSRTYQVVSPILRHMVGRIMTPPTPNDVHILTPRFCENVNMAKGTSHIDSG